MQVAPGVSRLTHGVSNFYLVSADTGLTLVDAGVAGDWKSMGRALAQLGKSPHDLKAILLTHAHADHTGFAERARTEWNTPVWVHRDDESVARGGAQVPNEGKLGRYLRHAEAWRTLFGLLFNGGVRVVPILAVSTFADGERIDVPGRPTVVHLPGHTAGMSGLVMEDRSCVLTGDAMVTRNPLTGRRGPQIMPRGLNRDSRQALESLKKLEDLPVSTVLPGHGDPWTGGVAAAVRAARLAGFS